MEGYKEHATLETLKKVIDEPINPFAPSISFHDFSESDKDFGGEEMSEGMSEDMVALALKYAEEKNRIKEIEASVKERKKALAEKEETLFAAMENAGMDSFSASSHTFYRRVDTYASIDAALNDKALGWVKEQGYEDAIKLTVNPRTLTAIVKEVVESGGDQPEKDEGIKLRVVNRVGIRKKA